MRVAKQILSGALWCLALHSACGLGTETTNGDGIVVTSAGGNLRGTSTDPGATVILCDTGLSPYGTEGLHDTLALDGNGDFFAEKMPEGMYNVFAYPRRPGLGAVVQMIPVQPGAAFSDSAVFRSLNKISGLVRYKGDIQKNAVAYIPGSPFRTKCDTNGIFVFDMIPGGDYTIIVRQDNANLGSPVDTLKVHFVNGGGSIFDTFDLKQEFSDDRYGPSREAGQTNS